MTVAFDTLSYAKKLTDAGESPEIAEVHALTLKELVNDELVTKQYFDLRMKELELRFKHDMAELKHDLTLRMGGMLTVAVGVLAVLMRIL